MDNDEHDYMVVRTENGGYALWCFSLNHYVCTVDSMKKTKAMYRTLIQQRMRRAME